jgi:hypothetical protein
MTTDGEGDLHEALQRLPEAVRGNWISEVKRLTRIVIMYEGIRPKRRLNPTSKSYKFVPEVLALCQEARCIDPVIVARERHRARPPSPYTLDQWLRDFKKRGSACFLRDPHTIASPQEDSRFAAISVEAVDWINDHWQEYTSPSFLHSELEKEAAEKGWTVPSESWLYRHWKNMPGIVRDVHLKGMDYYESRHAPYVPRDYSDLDALQVICGDCLWNRLPNLAPGQAVVSMASMARPLLVSIDPTPCKLRMVD